MSNHKNADDELREIADELEWYEPADPTPRHLCPCCDFVSLPERGEYLICPICCWEDDGFDLDMIDVSSGPNYMTLREARTNFQKFGACQEKMVQYVLSAEDRKSFEHHSRTLPEAT